MTEDPSLSGEDQGNDPSQAGPGQRLKEQREALGLTIEQVARELRMLRSVLQALEEDRYDALEAPIFVRGHLRNYARLLNLPAEEIVAAYDRRLPESSSPELKLDRPGPAMDAGTPAWVFSVAWIVVLAMLVTGGLWWYAGPHHEAEREQAAAEDRLVEAAREEVAEEEVASDEEAVAEEAVVEEAPEAATATDEAPALSPVVDQSLVLRELDETAATDAPDVAEEDAAADIRDTEAGMVEAALDEEGLPENHRRIALSLSEDSWLEIYDADEEQLYYGLAGEGDELELSGRPPISIFMGNAPAVMLSVDGEETDFSDRVRRDNTARFTVNPEP